jgi:hypothetical protein
MKENTIQLQGNGNIVIQDQAKATDSNLAGSMQFWAIMGHPCGSSFDAKSYLEDHPEYDFQKGYLKDMPGQEWFLTEKIIDQ